MRRALLSIVLLAAGCSACSALHPKPGDDCKSDDAVCTSKSGALICRNGKYAETKCGGPFGCAMAQNREVGCDQTSGAKADEPCLDRYAGQVQCLGESGSAYLRCSGGKWEKADCKAGGTCLRSGTNVVCRGQGAAQPLGPPTEALDGGAPNAAGSANGQGP